MCAIRRQRLFFHLHHSHPFHGIGHRSLQGFRIFSTLRWWNTMLSSINRPSGGIDSAHAGVSNKPRATNAAKHGWIQNATKWLDRDEVRSREPRHVADVYSPVQTVPVRAAHQGSADEAVDSPVASFTKCFSRKLIQDPKVAIQSTWRYFGVASVAFRQACQK